VVDDHIADVVPGIEVLFAGVAQTDDQKTGF